jgi:hypothetical protein
MLGVDALKRIRLGTLTGAAFSASCAYVTIGIMTAMHRHGYDYAMGWPTMRSAVDLTRSLNGYADTIAYTDIPNLEKYPQSLRTVRLLIPPASEENRRFSGRLLITFAVENGVKTGRMIVREIEPAEKPPGGTIDITPLPRNWVPDPATW